MAARTVAIVALAWLVGSPGGRSQPLPPLDEYHPRVYGLADGLLSAFVHRLHAGRDGRVYALNERGVVRFEGRAFEPVELPDLRGRPAQFHSDGAGGLWVQTDEEEVGTVAGRRLSEVEVPFAVRGVVASSQGGLWLLKSERLTRVRSNGTSASVTSTRLPMGLSPDDDHFVPEVNREISVEQSVRHVVRIRPLPSGRVRFDRSRPAVCPQNSRVSTLADAEQVWVAVGHEVCRIREGTAERVDPDTLTHRSFAWPPGQTVRVGHWSSSGAMARHAAEAIRRGVGDEALPRDGRLALVHYDPVGAPSARGGTLWIVFRRDGTDALARISGGAARRVALPDPLDARFINDVAVDHEGSVWVGTEKGAVQLVPRRALVLPPGPHLAEGFTTAVVQTRDGAVWVGTWGGGLHEYVDGRLARRLTVADGLPSPRVRSLHEGRDGTLWVGTRRGLAAVRGGRVAPVALPTAGRDQTDEVRDFTAAPDGTVWVATKGQLFRLAPGEPPAEVSPGHWRGENVWAVHRARDGTLWVGAQGGLYQVRDGRARLVGPEGVAPPYVVSIHETDDGAVWFGTFGSGIIRYRPGPQGGRFAIVAASDGLHASGIWRMLPDDRGGVWLSSDHGVARVSRAALDAAADAAEAGTPLPPVRPLVFTEAEGMPSRECNRAGPGGWRLADGRLVFNNLRGLVVIDPELATRAPPAPPVILLEATADGQPVPPGGGLRLPAGVRHATFEFAALSFVAPEQNRYRYRLDGYDDEWVEGAAGGRATYTGLPPGRYTLRIQGASGLSDYGQEAVHAVVVPPLLWQTWWFRTAAALLLLGALVAAYRYRVRRLLEVERLRLRIAADLHDDVGANLASIALASELLEAGLTEGARDGQRRKVRRIRAAARETIGALRDVVWVVDPTYDDLHGLLHRMRKAADELLDGTPHTFDGPRDARPRPLSVGFVHDVYLVYKEALHNVAKHAGASRVSVDVRVERGELSLVVRDDGVGFSVPGAGSAGGPGHGLTTMRRRAERLGGQLEIESVPGEGCRVALSARMA